MRADCMLWVFLGMLIAIGCCFLVGGVDTDGARGVIVAAGLFGMIALLSSVETGDDGSGEGEDRDDD